MEDKCKSMMHGEKNAPHMEQQYSLPHFPHGAITVYPSLTKSPLHTSEALSFCSAFQYGNIRALPKILIPIVVGSAEITRWMTTMAAAAANKTNTHSTAAAATSKPDSSAGNQ